MKKLIACLLALCLVFLLAACGGGKDKTVDLQALAADLAASSAFTMDISQYALDASIAAPTYGYDEADVKICQYYYNNGSNEEVLLVQASDSAAADKIEQCCHSRVELQKAALEAYNPDAIPRLDGAVVAKSGDYVVFVVANDNAAAKTVVDKYVQ